MPPVEAVEQELIAEIARLLFETVGQIDGNVGTKLAGAHLLCEKPALKRLIVVAATGSDDFV